MSGRQRPQPQVNGLNYKGYSESGLAYTGLMSINDGGLLSMMFFDPAQAGLNDSLWIVYGEMRFGSGTLWTMTGCHVDAFWYSTHSNFSVVTAITTSNPAEDRTFRHGMKIRLDREWASRVSELFRNSSGANLNTMLERAAAAIAIAVSDAGSEYLPGTLPVVFPDRIGGILPTPEENWRTTPVQRDALLRFVDKQGFLDRYAEVDNYAFDNWTDPARLSQISVQMSRRGYGYDPSETTVQLALAVLTFYCLIVAVFTAYTISTGVIATSWDTIGEFTLLALNSARPSHLPGTSVGVETLSTYRRQVSIRVNKGNSTELVFDDDPALARTDYVRAQPNAEYS